MSPPARRRPAAFLCAAVAAALLLPAPARADQLVLLDFDSGTDGSRAYAAAERTAVRDRMAGHYAPFDVRFTLADPGTGEAFSTITFNAGDTGGLARGIDFRNLVADDTAVVNVDGIVGPNASSGEFVNASANIGSHELGHLLGLRHHDSFGPIGSGIAPTVPTSSFRPAYRGPTAADETPDHLMASPASVGSSVQDLQGEQFFSERSAIKLSIAEDPAFAVIAEAAGARNTLATAQLVELATRVVPNSILQGVNAGMRLVADVAVVAGSLAAAGEVDLYAFDAAAGDLLNVELMSGSIAASRRQAGPGWAAFDTFVRLRDAAGNFVTYFNGDAVNDDGLEGFDSYLLDLTLPTDGRYYLEVDSFNNSRAGDYELYFHTFAAVAAVPEPGTWALVTFAAAGLAAGRRRRGAAGV